MAMLYDAVRRGFSPKNLAKHQVRPKNLRQVYALKRIAKNPLNHHCTFESSEPWKTEPHENKNRRRELRHPTVTDPIVELPGQGTFPNWQCGSAQPCVYILERVNIDTQPNHHVDWYACIYIYLKTGSPRLFWLFFQLSFFLFIFYFFPSYPRASYLYIQ